MTFPTLIILTLLGRALQRSTLGMIFYINPILISLINPHDEICDMMVNTALQSLLLHLSHTHIKSIHPINFRWAWPRIDDISNSNDAIVAGHGPAKKHSRSDVLHPSGTYTCYHCLVRFLTKCSAWPACQAASQLRYAILMLIVLGMTLHSRLLTCVNLFQC